MDILISNINQLYGLNLSSSEKVEKGFLCENYFLSDGKTKYFLKRYRFDNIRRIIEVHAAKEFFAHGGIPVILPIKLMDGTTFFEFEDGFFALFPFVDGIEIERGRLVGNSIASLGQMLGRMHLLGKHASVEIDDKFKIEDREKTMKKIENILAKIKEIEETSTLSDFDRLALKNTKLKKSLLEEVGDVTEEYLLPCNHLIHGDFLDHNVFFDIDGNVSHVFDFEKTCYSPRTYELFRSMFYGFLSEDFSNESIHNAKQYLDAYAEIYPISKEEIEKGIKLFFYKSIHGFWVESEHYLKDNLRADELLANDNKRTVYLSTNLDVFILRMTGGM